MDAAIANEGAFVARSRDLVEMAKSDPSRGLEAAAELKNEARAIPADGWPGEATAFEAAALWIEGAARFELGANDEAVTAMSAAVDLARQSGLAPLVDRVEISLAAAESAAGRRDEAIRRLGAVIDRTGGVEEANGDNHGSANHALALSQLGLLQLYAGNLHASLELLTRSILVLENHRSEAAALTRVLGNAGHCQLMLGRVAEARDLLERAGRLADTTNQTLVSLGCEQNLAYAHACLGHLPAALESYDRALAGYRRLAATSPNLASLYDDMAEAYRFAGLTRDALRHARLSLWTARQGTNRERQADAEYRRARCLLDHERFEAAADGARRAADLFGASGRSIWFRRAQLLIMEALDHLPDAGGVEADRLTDVAVDAARELDQAGWRADACAVRNLAARILIDQDNPAAARAVLLTGASEPDEGLIETEPVLGRLEYLYHQGLLAVTDGRTPGAHLARARRVLHDVQAGMVDPELQAGVARLTSRFRELDLDQAMSADSAARIVEVEEQWRSAMARPAAISRPHSEREAELLGELRVLCRDRDADSVLDEDRERRIAKLESEIRRLSFTHQPGLQQPEPGEAAPGRPAASLPVQASDIQRRLDGRCLVELVVHRRTIHAVAIGLPSAEPGEVGRSEPPAVHWKIGPWSEVLARSADITARLERLMRSRPGAASSRVRWTALLDDCHQFGRMLFGDRLDPDGEVVLVAPLGLTALPWRLVAGLQSGSLALAPNASVLASPADPVAPVGVGAVVGPGLPRALEEVEALGALLPSVQVARPAGVGDLVRALEEDSVVHIAAHCHFRSDSLLFSSLDMADGPVPVYQVTRLARTPKLVVLSACNGGRLSSTGHGEWLGLVSELLRLGTVSLVAPSHSVVDEDAAAVCRRFYHHLGALPVAAALAATQADLADADPRLRAASHSFTVFGSGRLAVAGCRPGQQP